MEKKRQQQRTTSRSTRLKQRKIRDWKRKNRSTSKKAKKFAVFKVGDENNDNHLQSTSKKQKEIEIDQNSSGEDLKRLVDTQNNKEIVVKELKDKLVNYQEELKQMREFLKQNNLQ